MIEKTIARRWEELLGKEDVLYMEPMKEHVTFQIGGPATYFLRPKTEQELAKILQICREEMLDYYVVGKGSNLLVSDQGYDGVIIDMSAHFVSITKKNDTVLCAKAGAQLCDVAKRAMEEGLTGFEFACGIPGTIGGACMMNAGAYGGEMKDVLLSATVMTPQGDILHLSQEEMELGYRQSILQKKNYIALEVCLSLEKGEPKAIQDQIEELTKRRERKQPLSMPSAGSTFKRPKGHFAGQLIEEAGLRGKSHGGAQVSEKHCGFVVNKGDATAEDVVRLLQEIIQQVEETSGVRLEPEVRMLGISLESAKQEETNQCD